MAGDKADEPSTIQWFNYRSEAAAWGIRPVVGGYGSQESQFTLGGTTYVFAEDQVTPAIADYEEEP